MAFRRDIPFKVSKEESKTEPTPEQTEAKKESLDAAELEKFRGQWRSALEEAWAFGSRENVKKFTVKGKAKLFYRLQTLEDTCSPGLTQQKFIMIDEDLLPRAVSVKYTQLPAGTRVDTEEQNVDPKSVDLSPQKIAALVKRMVEGEL
jgi:hypothetical protein